MRISKLTIQNFLGLSDFRHTLTSPFLFVAGPNGAGKSSLQDAIKFVLVDEMARGITKIGDRPRLLTEGSAAGFVQLEVDGYEIRRNIGSGKLSGDAPAFPKALGLCLDATRFASMPEADRKRWLFELAGVTLNREAVAQQLTAAGIPDYVIEKVMPLLRDGFPAAAAYCKEQASQARGAWKSITGENYGSVKASTWTAQAPEVPATQEEIDVSRRDLQACEARVQALTEAKGRAAGAVSIERMAQLKRQADAAADNDAQLERCQTVYDQALAQVNALSAEAAGHSGTVLDCPSCQAMLLLEDGALRVAPEVKEAPSKVKAKLNGAKQALSIADRDLNDARAAQRASDAAKLALDNLPTISEEDKVAPAKLEEELGKLGVYRNALRAVEESMRLSDAAHGQTERAKEAHERALSWIAADEQLGPDGIPATLLSKALDPINDALATQARVAGFLPARVERDLALSYGGRYYNLASESEQWRADALFAVVVAILSGCRLVTIDRFDVLDPGSRGDAIDWLQGLTEAGHVETVILSGTLKGKPDLGEGIDVVWIPGLEQAA